MNLTPLDLTRSVQSLTARPRCRLGGGSSARKPLLALTIVAALVVIASFSLTGLVSVSPSKDTFVAIVTEDPGSMPANLKFLGIKSDVFSRDNVQGLDLAKYRVVVFDYQVGVGGGEVQPLFDVAEWMQRKQSEVVQWIRDGGSIIDFSAGENPVLYNLTVKDAHEPEILVWIRKDEAAFQVPNTLGDNNFTSSACADAYIVGGTDLDLFNITAKGNKGPVLLTRNLEKGKIVFCCIQQDGSIFRRGLVENFLYWATNGSLRRAPFTTVELNTNHFRLRYPSFASSVETLNASLDIAVEKLHALAGYDTKTEAKMLIDFTRDLEWEMGVSTPTVTVSETYVDIWELPELVGSENALHCILYHELGHLILGRKDFMGPPFTEAFAELGNLYCLDDLSQSKTYNASAETCKNELRKYLEQGANFTQVTSPQLTGVFLTLKDEYGWSLFENYFHLIDPSVKYQRIPRDERLSLFAYYLSTGAGQDLVQRFRDWGFPVQHLSEMDTTPPTVSITSPRDSSTAATNRPTIEASLNDNIAVDASSAKLLLNDQDVTHNTTITSTSISYTPQAELPDGQNNITITVRDLAGNPTTLKGDFTVSRTRILTLSSSYGVVSGGGVYNTSSTASISVLPDIVEGDAGVRHVFIGWNSTSPGGYTGTGNPAEVVMNTNISEVAQWKTQYYLKMDSDTGGTVSPSSGWYDAGSKVFITASPKPGFSFSSWIGNGPGSYSGSSLNETVTLNGSITETAALLDVAAPVAEAGADQTVKVGEKVALDTSRCSDNSGVFACEWDLGDGTNEILPMITHAYKKPGTYTVTLKVMDRAGNRAADTVKITVVEAVEQVDTKWGFTGWIAENWLWIACLAGLALIVGVMPYVLTKAT